MVKSLLLAFLFANALLPAIYAGPVTLYRIIKEGDAPDVVAASPVTALGVNSDNGGTTYEQVEVFTSADNSWDTGHPLHSPSTTLPPVTNTRTQIFVEAASWAYQSYQNAGGKFNGWEVNCTIPDAKGKKSECVNINRDASGSTTLVSTTTFAGSAIPRYTATGAIPMSTSSGTRARSISLFALIVLAFVGGLLAV